MKPSSRILPIVAGYVAALVLAIAVVGVNFALKRGQDNQASSGMSAFGDAILFLGVFGLAAIPATGAGLFLLRPHGQFWRAASVVAVAIAATGIAALVDYLVSGTSNGGSLRGTWSILSPLRLLLAPAFAVVLSLAGVFSPGRAARRALLGASVIEFTIFVWAVLKFLHLPG